MTYGEAVETLLVYPVIDGYARIDAGLVSDVVKMVKDLEKDNERYLNHISMLQEKIRNGSEWISVEDEPIPGEQSHIFTVLPKIIIKRNPETGEPAYWMRIDPPKPKEPTFKDVFLKAFPKAVVLEHSGVPRVCAKEVFPQLGDDESPCDMRCAVCWNQPYFEEEVKE